MKIGILGYGKEGQSAEQYFTANGDEVQIFDDFTPESIAQEDLSEFDLVLRSPSVPPQAGWSSVTQYFFAHCPCPIIGVTGTKGKGTTCSIIAAVLEALGKKVWLVGNIGNPATDVLKQIQPENIAVYEMSSFQLWDLPKSPHIAVLTTIEPDHLDVHKDFAEYVQAKANIAKHQNPDDYCIYYANNAECCQIAEQSKAQKIAYPVAERGELDEVLAHLSLRGQHNRYNAEAALLAVVSSLQVSLAELIQQYREQIIQALANFQGLPHRLQYLRELNGVKYYDDNFSTTLTSLQVALRAFPEQEVVLIAGGRDKTENEDIPKIAEAIKASTVSQVILIGESGRELEKILDGAVLADSLEDAVTMARQAAEQIKVRDPEREAVVLMSPAAASFDMFTNVYGRGAKFQALIQELK